MKHNTCSVMMLACLCAGLAGCSASTTNPGTSTPSDTVQSQDGNATGGANNGGFPVANDVPVATADDTSGDVDAEDTPSVSVPDASTPSPDADASVAAPDADATSTTEADAAAADAMPSSPDTVEPSPDVVPDVVPEPPLPEVRFVALGDVGEGNENQYEVAAAIAEKCAADGCDFAILLGDNVYDAGVSSVVDSQWEEKFEAPYENLDFPFYAVLGNHDNGGLLSALLGDTFDGAGAEFEKGDIQVAYTDVSDKWMMPARIYDFQAGPAHFFALDTNDMMWAPAIDEAQDRANTQKAETPDKMDASPAMWKIVMGHHPYISNGAHGNAGEYEGLDEDVMTLAAAIPFLGDILDGVGSVATGVEVKDALETILCGRADLYLSGHDHNRQWLSPVASCPGVQFVVSGAGSKTKDLEGSNPTEFEDASIGGFLWVHIKGPVLTAEFIDQDGVVNFSTTIEK